MIIRLTTPGRMTAPNGDSTVGIDANSTGAPALTQRIPARTHLTKWSTLRREARTGRVRHPDIAHAVVEEESEPGVLGQLL
jgi:hypothetical protein